MSSIEKIKLEKIDSFNNHPFKVNNDDSLKELANSIKANGLLNPLTVRKKDSGRYELVSGHRRKMAMELIGIKEASAYVKELTDDEAIIEMVDSNMYRDKILPSEKAFAYRMKFDAIKHQGRATDQVGPKLSVEKIGKDNGDSSSQVKRYIRLTNLIPELLQMVDDTVLKDKRTALTMGLNPAVELSYLNKDEQKLVYMGITYEDLTPSLVQDKSQIGIIFVNNDATKKLLNGDILNADNIDDVTVKEFVNEKYYDQFIKDRLNKDDFFTDRESAILFGIPSNLIEGILVGRKYEKDDNVLNKIKKLLPDAYICNLDGIVIK